MLEYLVELIGDEAEVWLLGDAGFESVHLFNWLTQHNWHFVLRHPGKNKVRWPGQPWVKLSAIPVQPGETRNIGWVELTAKHAAGPYWLTIHWATGEEEPWFLLSDCTDDRTLLRLYAIRMWTEELYGDLKSHGFDLEATHLDDADRIARLVLAVCINFVWFIALGVWLVKRGWRHLLDHKSRRDKSYFRLGLDWLDRCFRLNHPIPLRFTLYF
ncbi:MAG: transposase [Caldilineaceae bacterium]